MQRDIGDILDRCSIAQLKSERIGNIFQEEYDAFVKAKESIPTIVLSDSFYKLLYTINANIWKLEAALKGNKEELVNQNYLMDKENTDALRNIGITTVLIRDWNNVRVQVKNLINSLAGEGFQDKKHDHLSE